MASLPHFDDWMAEQKIESVIFQIGIARFISSRCVLSLCVYMSDDKVRLYESASSALESPAQERPHPLGDLFRAHSMWLAGKHGNDEVKRVQSLLSVSENNMGRPRCWASIVCSTSAVLPSKPHHLRPAARFYLSLTSSLSMFAVNNSKVYLWHCSAKGSGSMAG